MFVTNIIILDVSSYVAEEKVEIARKYLIPQVLDMTGLKAGNISLSDEALSLLIKSYCRESGVRNLRKQIEKIYRKTAYLVVSENRDLVSVGEDNLKDFVGKPVFLHDKMYAETPSGVCLGLAWTSMGGSTLYIETMRQQMPKDVKADDKVCFRTSCIKNHEFLFQQLGKIFRSNPVGPEVFQKKADSLSGE